MLVVIFLGLISFDLFIPYGGNLRYAAAWIKCGSRPYVEAERWFGGGVRSYELAPDLYMYRNLVKEYYCTQIEAERDGLSASSKKWEFPHLDAAGEPWPI